MLLDIALTLESHKVCHLVMSESRRKLLNMALWLYLSAVVWDSTSLDAQTECASICLRISEHKSLVG